MAITKTQREHAERIVELDGELGHLPIGRGYEQTVRGLLNLSIPLAHLVVAGLVTGIDRDSDCGMCEQAVADVESYCVRAIRYAVDSGKHSAGELVAIAERGQRLGLELDDELATFAGVADRYRTVRS